MAHTQKQKNPQEGTLVDTTHVTKFKGLKIRDYFLFIYKKKSKDSY